MSALLFISAAIYVVYIVMMCAMFGVPESISDTCYLLERRKKGRGKLFMFFLWAVVFTLCPHWFDASPDNIRFLVFFAASGLLLTGAAHRFKEHEATIHFAGAMTSVVATMLWLIFAKLSIFIPVVPLFLLGAIFKRNTYIFWSENGAFVALFSALIYLQIIN